MKNETNKAIVRTYHERVVGSGNYDEAPRFIGADYLDHDATRDTPRGPIAAETHLRGIRNVTRQL